MSIRSVEMIGRGGLGRVGPGIDLPVWAESWIADGIATLHSRVLDGAAAETAGGLAARVREAMLEIFGEAAASRHGQIVRMWNFIPDIHGIPLRSDGGEDRYMAFNAGRYEAMTQFFGAELSSRVPAASGVGCAAADLTIHALSIATAGKPLNNPWQTPAYRYSSKYGHQPPCFCRAMETAHGLLISGTAAIRGEDSLAKESWREQLKITLNNLSHFLATRTGGAFRAYLPAALFQDGVAEIVKRETDAAMGAEVEYVQAELCRRELLIEIEGMVS